MSLVLSVTFCVFIGVLITASVILAVYMVLGLLVVENLRQPDSQYKALQRQTRFLVDGTSTPVMSALEECDVFGWLHSASKPSFPSGCKTDEAEAGANKPQTTSEVYGVALQ